MTWYESELTRRVGIRLPIVQAPMAGGWTTARLIAEVSEAGGLGSIGGAASGPDQLRALIREVRSLTGRPFAVNLFAALPEPSDRGLTEWSRLTGRPVPAAKQRPRLADQLAVVVEERVPVLSFTFGVVPLDGIDAFTIGTATTVAEAVALQEVGVDAVVAQGYEAGGHRGTFLAPVEHSLIGTLALVPQVVDAVSLPVIASGGIMDGRGIAAARVLGASAVQLGTAFLSTDEAGTDSTFRAALGLPTTVTKMLTGRHARAMRTELVERLEAAGVEPPDYPLPRGFLDGQPPLSGQGGALARALPAHELVALLEQETAAALAL